MNATNTDSSAPASGNTGRSEEQRLRDAEKMKVMSQATLFYVKKNAYTSRRRNAYGELPGLVPHYPNALYTDTSIA